MSSLTEDFYNNYKQFDEKFQFEFDNLQKIVTNSQGIAPAWACSCFNRLLGLIDGIAEIVKITPIAKQHCLANLDPLVAIGKMSYTFMNNVSLLHDILDNIGFALGLLYFNKSNDQKSKSFYQLFNSDGKIASEIYPEHIFILLAEMYDNSRLVVDIDNQSKHKFFSGVGELYVPKEMLESSYKQFSGNTLDLFDYNMISIDNSLEITLQIKNQLLLPVIRLVNKVAEELTGNQMK